MIHQPIRSPRKIARARHLTRAVVLCLSCWTVESLVGSSVATAASPRVAAKIEGAGSSDIRSQIVSSLPAGSELGDSPQLAQELSRRGLTNLVAAFRSEKRRPVVLRKLRNVERAIGADVLVLGTIANAKRRGSQDLHLVVVLVSQRDAAVDEMLPIKRGAVSARQLQSLLGGAIDRARSAAAASEKQATEAADRAAAASQEGKEDTRDESREEGASASGAEPGSQAGGQATATTSEGGAEGVDGGASRAVTPLDALVVGFLGLDFGGRQFHYNQRVTEANLRPFDLPSAGLIPITPGATLAAEVYPFARTSWPVARDVGIDAHLDYDLAKAKIGTANLDTTWYAWDVSLRGRVHLGDRGASPLVGVEGGIGSLVFKFHDPAGQAGLSDILPGVDYQYLRLGADGRIPVKRVDVVVGAGFRHLLSKKNANGQTILDAGSVGDHFPRASITGLDARVGVAVPIRRNLEARLTVTYVRFWAAFNSRPGDTYIAGGAVDHMIHADLGIAAYY